MVLPKILVLTPSTRAMAHTQDGGSFKLDCGAYEGDPAAMQAQLQPLARPAPSPVFASWSVWRAHLTPQAHLGSRSIAASTALKSSLCATAGGKRGLNSAPRLSNTKVYSSTYLAMGFANVRAGTQKRRAVSGGRSVLEYPFVLRALTACKPTMRRPTGRRRRAAASTAASKPSSRGITRTPRSTRRTARRCAPRCRRA